MALPFIAIAAAAPQVAAAVSFQASVTAFAAAALQFIGTTLANAALSGSKQPGLTDLSVQTSQYGIPIPLVFGERVRIAGNVIDKSDLIPIKHKKGQMLGVGGVKYYTYDVHLQVLLADGIALAPNGLVKIYGDGKVVFDRDRAGSSPGVTTAQGATEWTKASNGTQNIVNAIRLYRGAATQGVDPLVQSFHPSDTISAYRHATTVVFERLALTELFGSRVPNLEFEVEPLLVSLSAILLAIGDKCGVTIDCTQARGITCQGFVVAKDGTGWEAMQPLGGVFAFDLVQQGAGLKVVKRGGYMRTTIAEGNYAAAPVGQRPDTKTETFLPDIVSVPNELTLNYLDPERGLQPNSQRASRFKSVSENKASVDIPVVMTADEARSIAQRSLYEAQARQRPIRLTLSERYRWLDTGDLVGLTVAGNVEPFRLGLRTRSPNGMIDIEATYEDVLLYSSDLTGDVGNFPVNELAVPGDTTIQPIDGAIVRTSFDSAAAYFTFAGESEAWGGAEVYRALGIGSPLTYAVIGNIGAGAVMANANTTLASGPTDLWDEVNTLTVTLINSNDTLTSATMADVETTGANLAWLGGADGQDGEFIHFRDATEGSPAGTYVLSGLLRGRFGTESFVGSHASGERLVMCDDTDALYRPDFTAADWNAARTYRADSIPGGLTGTGVEFTNTGVAKRPLAPVHLLGTRNGSNNDVSLSWERRSRYTPPPLGGGPVPLGEATELYALSIYNGVTVVRELTSTTNSFNYTTAMQTADGNTPGALVRFDVSQVSDVYGPGLTGEGTV